MAGWFRRRRDLPASPARVNEPIAARLALAELTPPATEYLGLAAYLELTLFEDAGRAIALAPTTAAKSALSAVAQPHLLAHEGMVAELRRRGRDPVGAMEPHRRDLDEYRRRVEGQDWFEAIVTCYLTAGFLTDFFRGLAAGLPPELRTRMEMLLDIRESQRVLTELLLAAIDGNPRLAARLAMWGRRLVGDTMLVARGALGVGIVAGQERIEPVFTELIAAHTRRMAALGLTA
ncbi:MAG: hypothetical protein HY996_03685 [Micrococcales bacterium]|nr:hypothetical protein [Micrococcales bacterium]